MRDRRRSTPASKSSKRSHWYHPALKSDTAEPTLPSERSRLHSARARQARRDADRQLPKVDWTWFVIGAAVFGVIATIALLMLATTSTSAAPGAVALSDATSNSEQAATAPGSDGQSLPPTAQPITMADLESLNLSAWDGQRRLTVLVMGLDKRPGEVGRSFRSDTIIVLSIDPKTQSIGMLSIPRDVRVAIPNRPDLHPINTAYVIGELERPGYGPRLTAETIQYNLGIKIDHYVALTFEAVIQFIDAIGGITIDVPSEIVDNEYPDMAYGFEPLYIAAGTQRMDGALALKYARTRHQTNDFDRAKRQQQVILAARNQLLRADVLPGVVLNAPTLWGQISQGLITDLSFEQVLSLGWYLKDIPLNGIQRGTLEANYIRAMQLNGESILTINRETIAELMIATFGADYNQ